MTNKIRNKDPLQWLQWLKEIEKEEEHVIYGEVDEEAIEIYWKRVNMIQEQIKMREI